MTVSVNIIWERICKHEGETFYTKSKLPLTYEVAHDMLKHTRTAMPVAKEAFAIVLEHVPMDGPGDAPKRVFGQSYIWAILHDKRIRLDDY